MNDPLRILWLKTGPLHPADTGGKIRTLNMLREMRKRHRVTYLSLLPELSPETVTREAWQYSHDQIWVHWRETPKYSWKFYAEVINDVCFSPRPYIIDKYRSTFMEAHISESDEHHKHDLIVCDFLTPAVNLPGLGRFVRTPVLLFQHNVEALIWKRHYETEVNFFKRRFYKGQWRRMQSFEKEACESVTAVVAVSEPDCELMRKDYGLKNVLGAVPTGVDIEHFKPVNTPRKPRSVAFLGSMDWMPNVDAMMWFVEDMMPALKQKYPDLTVTVIGRNPIQRVKDLARRHDFVRVTGTVDDVRQFLNESELMIVPLRVGGGTRIKIFEAMATGIPCVSTRIGAEGLPVTHGEHILLADNPADFVREIGALFDSRDLREKVGANARSLVEKQFSWESITAVFETYCHEVAQRGRSAVKGGAQ